METDIERRDSCELSISQKGKYSGKIKIYADKGEDAMNEAKRLANELRTYILEVNLK